MKAIARLVTIRLTDMELTQDNIKRLHQIVQEYAERHNWSAIARLIGGSPRYDLNDYTDADNGGDPAGYSDNK